MDFQRARSEEQRTLRRQSILRTATAMLGEMPVAAMSLNELSRRVGLAKSNVLRYFETREAVLLDLLEQAAAEFLVEITETLPGTVNRSDPAATRVRELAAGLAVAFSRHPLLCELLSSQAGVLEHNVSTEVAAKHKREARDILLGFADLLRQIVPELDKERAARAASMIIMFVGALWTLSHPAPAVVAAIEADPSLAFMCPPFAPALDNAVATYLAGLLAD